MKKIKKQTKELGLATLGLSTASMAMQGMPGSIPVKGQSALSNVSKTLPVAGSMMGVGLLGRTIKKVRK